MSRRVVLLCATAVLPLLSLAVWLLPVLQADGGDGVLINAVLYDGIASGEPDEAVQLRNVGDVAVDVSGWSVTDGEATAVLPPDVTLNPGASIWLARNGEAFQETFGFWPDFELGGETAVPDLSGSWSGLANGGDQVMLFDETAVLVDCLPFAGNYSSECGSEWSGEVVLPYSGGGAFGVEGQILYRKRNEQSGLPVVDTNRAADWAQDPDDVLRGRKVQYPGWDVDTFFETARVTETAVLTIAIAPDNAYEAIVNEINSAQTSIEAEALTFENVAIANALVAAANRGVAVTVLLEGGPTGGLEDQEKFICQLLDAAGGACWFMIRDDGAHIADRYRYVHAKFMLIDGVRVLISSENLSPNSLPYDDKSDGTWGRRGVVLITDAPGVVAHVNTIFDLDFDVVNHRDLFRWQVASETYGAPPLHFDAVTASGGITYQVRYPQPLRLVDSFAFEVVQSPENSLRTDAGLLGLVNRAGAGDTVLVQQLSERPFWGSSASNPTDDPNPRLEAYLDAARRGADVQLLLDALFDDNEAPTGNSATCAYVNQLAKTENLLLRCTIGNPAGLGIHNKMVLVQIDGQGYLHVGSLNGSEQSSKGNRELALQVQSDAAYAYLAEMFATDWPEFVYLPLVLSSYVGPAPTVLISEVLYDPFGADDAEFVELVNPTAFTIDLSQFSLGDAVNVSDFEDVRRFPGGTLLLPGETLVVAFTATGFEAAFGVKPDFEIVGTDTAVPDLIDDPKWGDPAALLQLANGGDEVILRNASDQAVDVVTYGSGSFPGVVGCGLVSTANHSLERYPYWKDTDDCAADFRDWPLPNPGVLP